MAQLILAMFTSLDGYVAGQNGELIPPPWSKEVAEAWADRNLRNAGHLIYGRVNFQFNKAHWTSPAASAQPQTDKINRLPKTVISRTLSGDPGWNGSVADGDLTSTVTKLRKSVAGGDIYCFGGAELANSLMSEALVDEYYLMVTPSIQGTGKRLFKSGLPNAGLEFIQARPLDTGSVILHYRRK